MNASSSSEPVLYRLNWREGNAQIESIDGRVIRATPSMRWAIGKSLRQMFDWCGKKGIELAFDNKPSPVLVAEATPSDSEIAKRTS